MVLEHKISKLKTPDIGKNWHTPCLISQQKPPKARALVKSLVAHLFSLTRKLMPSEDLG